MTYIGTKKEGVGNLAVLHTKDPSWFYTGEEFLIFESINPEIPSEGDNDNGGEVKDPNIPS